MVVLNDNKEKVVIEFSKKEYYQIQDCVTGKEAGEIDIEIRDTLETFLILSNSMNPEDNIQEILKSINSHE